MANSTIKHSNAWKSFTFLNFGVSVSMMGAGIFLLPLDLAVKGFLFMGSLMMLQSAITLTKTMRDEQEADQLLNKIEDAKTEKLLMDISGKQAT